MELTYYCPSCGATNRLACPLAAADPAGHECDSCAARLAFARRAGPAPSQPIQSCCVCGGDKLFVQKRFNQKAGCAIVGLGAVLTPWTYGLSLAACALLDLLLYRMLPMITVCYVCGTRYSGFPIGSVLRPYDLMTAQTYEARALTWRRLHDSTGGP